MRLKAQKTLVNICALLYCGTDGRRGVDCTASCGVAMHILALKKILFS